MKALAGSNVSRGFESRPLCSMNYRLDRRFVLRALGLNVMCMGTLMVGAFLLSGVWSLVCAALVVLLLANAIWLAGWPPAVVRTTADGVRVGGRLTVRPVSLTWTEVEDVGLVGDRLHLNRGDQRILDFPLAYVGARRDELIREIYDRLNTAHGYRRFDPA
ncbi:MAG: hypothetical protein QOJ72_1393 [Nocardioidaceae bacterium]|nr:hypothetical protein [Nocardioidaceae bacterium]